MKIRTKASLLAANGVLLLALASCSGGGSTSTAPPVTPPQSGAGVLSTIVGIGDSLTFGEQAEGLLGLPGSSPVSNILPGNLVPPTQENGYFALFYEQAKGVSAASMANPATSVLPLINAPGLYSQLVPTKAPPGFAASHSPCDAFNQAAFQASTALSVVRANGATIPYDLGVPGQTMHQALYQIAPITGPPTGAGCTFPANPGDPTAGALQALVLNPSVPFYPVLGNFVGKVANPDQIDDAVSLHPTLALVWLGSNDLLNFSFAGGSGASTDTPAQFQTDLTLAIQKLQTGGARVAVATLSDVLGSAQFFKGGPPPPNPQVQCSLQNYVFCAIANQVAGALAAKGVPGPAAQAEGQQVAQQVVAQIAAKYSVTGNGYLTLTGTLTALQEALGQLAQGAQPSQIVIQLDLTGAGSGLGGYYVPDALAAQVQGLNNAYNAEVVAVAASTGAALVDVHAAFAAIKNGQSPLNAINPGKCCSLAFGGGLLSFDGLHPSNTGYAAIANIFIQQANASFGLQIAPVNVQAIYATDLYAPH